MRRPPCWVVVIPVAGALFLSACAGSAPSTRPSLPAAHVERIAGTSLSRLSVTPSAADRIGIKTESVQTLPSGTSSTKLLVIPYASVVYDTHGGTWAYTSIERDVFVRTSIRIDHIAGDRAVLSAGPPSGTLIVITGAAELYGLEFSAK
jgi:hypothetical protein